MKPTSQRKHHVSGQWTGLNGPGPIHSWTWIFFHRVGESGETVFLSFLNLRSGKNKQNQFLECSRDVWFWLLGFEFCGYSTLSSQRFLNNPNLGLCVYGRVRWKLHNGLFPGGLDCWGFLEPGYWNVFSLTHTNSPLSYSYLPLLSVQLEISLLKVGKEAFMTCVPRLGDHFD